MSAVRPPPEALFIAGGISQYLGAAIAIGLLVTLRQVALPCCGYSARVLYLLAFDVRGGGHGVAKICYGRVGLVRL